MFEEINPYIIFASSKTKAPNILRYKKRKVRWYEIELITSGGGYIETDGENIKADEGSVFFRRPGMVVQGYLPYTGYLIVFDMCYDSSKLDIYSAKDSKGYENTSISSNQDNDNLLSLPNVLEGLYTDKYEPLFNDVYEKFLISSSNQLPMKASLLKILSELLKDNDHKVSINTKLNYNPKHYVLMNDVKKYINEHLTEKITLDDLAEVANYSTSFLSRTFKATYGISPFDYINNKKIDKIKQLLIDTDISVSKMCEMYGYTESFFYRLFKRKVGMTPKEFKNEYLEQVERYL